MRAYCLLAAALLLLGCDKKELETYTSEPLSDYIPLQTGKFITYRIDSTVFTNFGRNVEIHSYQEKHVVDAQITDAMGRNSYRVFRFLNGLNAPATDPWQPAGSYSVTPGTKTVELIENNLRLVKLALPVAEKISWKGFQFLSEESFRNYGLTSNFFVDYENTIESVNQQATINGKSFNSVISVHVVDEAANSSSGTTVTDRAGFASRNYMAEKYAKGVGLIYQEILFWEYQPNSGGYQNGFGVKRSVIDYN